MTNTISKIAKTLVMGLALSTSVGVYAGGIRDIQDLKAVFQAVEPPIQTALQRSQDLYKTHGISGLDANVPQVGSDHPYLASLDIGPKYGVKVTFKAFTEESIITGSTDQHDKIRVPNFLSEARIIIFPGTEIPLGGAVPTVAPAAELTLFDCATDIDGKVTAFYGDIGNNDDTSIISSAATLPYLTGCVSVSAADLDALFAAY